MSETTQAAPAAKQQPVTENPTAGPWVFSGPRIYADIVGGLDIAAAAAMPVPGGFSVNGETIANARLIAAAPDLLELARAVLRADDQADGLGDSWANLRSVIAHLAGRASVTVARAEGRL